MRIREFMSANVETIDERSPAEQALTRMRMRSIHHLVVLREGRVAGVISERDLGGRRAGALARGRFVGDLMSPHAVTISADATAREAARLLRGRNIGCLPVTEGGQLVGIVTSADLLDLIGRGMERPIETSRARTMSRRGPRRRSGIRRGA